MQISSFARHYILVLQLVFLDRGCAGRVRAGLVLVGHDGASVGAVTPPAGSQIQDTQLSRDHGQKTFVSAYWSFKQTFAKISNHDRKLALSDSRHFKDIMLNRHYKVIIYGWNG